MKHGIVVAGHDATANAANTILIEGGNAFDAMVAGFLTSCIAESCSISLGGGGFMLAAPSNKAPKIVDFFTQTPKRKKSINELDFFPIEVDYKDSIQTFHIGIGSIAVPGNVAAIFDIHERYCTIPLKELAQPALNFAKSSWEVDSFQEIGIDLLYPILSNRAEQAAIYTNKDGSKKKKGDLIHIPYIADAIDTIIREGKREFYEGEFAHRLIKDCEQEGGYLDYEDLKSYKVNFSNPINIPFKNYEIMTNPPPGSGGLLIAFALKLIEKAGLNNYDFGSKSYIELLARTMFNVESARKDLIDGKNINNEALKAFLSENTINAYFKNELSKIGSTTHLSIIDKFGNAASLTHSSGEGSGYMIPKTGIMMNNMLGEADLMPLGFHKFPNDKRISSMMSPTIVKDKKGIKAVIGSGGANRIRAAIFQTILNLLDFNMDLEKAVNAPRIHLEQNDLHIEGAFDHEIVKELNLKPLSAQFWNQKQHMFFGGVNAIASIDDSFVGYGDKRRFGVVKGC